MMPNQSFFIPLYFDEAEADLWLALQGIEPEKRSGFIKATLRQVLLNGAEASNPHSLEVDIEENETFSLEALFSEVNELDPDEESEGLANHEKAKPTSQRFPWDYLLHSVIGVEDDESVIAALKQVVHSNLSEYPVDKVDIQLDQVGDQELDLESLHVDTPISLTGFEYMMKHIIGTEEDEVVLKILRGGSETKIEVRSSKSDSK